MKQYIFIKTKAPSKIQKLFSMFRARRELQRNRTMIAANEKITDYFRTSQNGKKIIHLY